MASIVYLLCGLTSTLCFIMLIRGYLHTRTRLLLSSSICFAALAINNILLYVDVVLTAGYELSIFGIPIPLIRTLVSLVGVSILLYTMLWETV